MNTEQLIDAIHDIGRNLVADYTPHTMQSLIDFVRQSQAQGHFFWLVTGNGGCHGSLASLYDVDSLYKVLQHHKQKDDDELLYFYLGDTLRPVYRSTVTLVRTKLLQQAEALREQCISLIWEYVRQEPDENLSNLLTKQVAMLRLLPLSTAVLDTFRGILGYDCWLGNEHTDSTESFLTEVMHDVQECIANHEKEWYSPRTSAYVQFYKPKE